MDPERSAEWAARVVAWHRRDPLARRVEPADVGDFGWIDLPYAGAESRDRWRPVFSAPVGGLRAARVAAWALRHGQRTRPESAEPLQQVPIDRALLPVQGEVALLWVGRVTLKTPHGRTTLLVDPRPGGPVLGRRLRSRPRTAVAATALAGFFGLTSAFAWVVAGGRDAAPGLAAGAPVAVASGPMAASTAVSTVAAGRASGAASGVAAVAPAASEAAAPASAGGAAAAGPAVAAAPAASAVSRSAAAASAPGATNAALAAVAASAAPPPRAPAVASAAPASAAPARAASPARPPFGEPLVTTGPIVADKPVFLDEADRIVARATGDAARAASAARRVARHAVAWALAGPPLRTPAEAQLAGRDLAKALAGAGAEPCPRIDAMPVGDDWRMVCWPFTRRADGERRLAALGDRARAIELVEF